MKHIIVLLITLNFSVGIIYAQRNIVLHPPIFSLKQSRFSIGVSLETAPLIINSSKPESLSLIYYDPRLNNKPFPYTSYGFVFDLYSAKSVIGLLSGFDYIHFNFGAQNSNKITDFMNVNGAEVPLCLKFRFGQIASRKHLWLLLGGIYNFPISCTREQFDAKLGSSATTNVSDNNKAQLNSYFSLTSSIGYEFFARTQKHFRYVVYSKITYPLGTELNNNYSEFKSGGNSILKNYSDFDLREYRISVGIKLMFQFGEALGIMTDAIKK